MNPGTSGIVCAQSEALTAGIVFSIELSYVEPHLFSRAKRHAERLSPMGEAESFLSGASILHVFCLYSYKGIRINWEAKSLSGVLYGFVTGNHYCAERAPDLAHYKIGLHCNTSSKAKTMRTSENLEITLSCVAFLWAVYFVGMFLPLDLQSHGIRPRSVSGLQGLIFSPFLHAGWRHLLSNTLALAALLFFSLTFSRKLTLRAVIWIALLGGGATWLFGKPNTIHIGASGIIFGLIGYLMTIGIFRGELMALVISIAIAFYYGWALFSLFQVLPGVSWAGHFFGFLGGVSAAWLTRKTPKEGAVRSG